ncbi:ribonuclease BN [Sphingobacterium corticibacter]|uniref:Ribonuclease BN n=2 Tax=Sphingobacterium corticibacter TaxID=2171749 RepID=A0A2T8HLV3_9SPHI|nr:ribonuclease BN [Sphingobacterium corticibacter]
MYKFIFRSMLQKIKEYFRLVYDAGMGFMEHDCLKMSAALSYYTVFSIGPLVMILIWTLGFFYGNQIGGNDGAQNEVMEELTALFGQDIAVMLESAIQKISSDSKSNIGFIIGIGTLIFTSTTIFVNIQQSINTIWNVKPKPKKGWLKMIINRLLSFSMILGLAFLLMASLILSSIIGLLSTEIGNTFSWINIDLIDWVNTAVTFVVISTLFGFIFSVLPDAKVRFKDILGGAIFTALLFMLGKWGISMYLSNNATASAFGAAGSIIILLSWVYYTSAIIFFGAEFTKRYAIRYGHGIQPSSYAVVIEQTEYEYDPNTGKREKIDKQDNE